MADNEDKFSKVKQLIAEGVTMIEIGDLDTATGLFEAAGTNLMVHFLSLVVNNQKPSFGEQVIFFFAPFFRPGTPAGSPFSDQGSCFRHPFTFVMLDEDGPTAISPHIKTHSEMAAYTATIIFNLGLCNHLHGEGSFKHLETATKHYTRAWHSAFDTTPASSQSSGGMMVLQMAICLNLSDCLYNLGELDQSYLWVQRLGAICDFCHQRHVKNRISEHLLDFFCKAATARTRCIAAGAA
jgi:hypothetical protein